MLATDRETATREQLAPLPGQAEYLDLIGAVVGWKDNADEQLEIIETIRTFAFRKHRSMLAEAERRSEFGEEAPDDDADSGATT